MKIAYVIDSLSCGGAEQQLVTLCQGLKRRHHDVHVVTIHDRMELRGDLDCLGIPVKVVRKHGKYDVSAVWRLRRLLVGIAPELVHAYLPTAALMTPLSLWRGATFPILQSERGVNDWRSTSRIRLERLLRTHVAHITCNAETIKRHLIAFERVPADRIAVIYNGLRSDRRSRPDEPAVQDARLQIGAPDGATTVICVANFSPVKQHEVVVEALARVRERFANVFLVLVGNGPRLGHIHQQIRSLGLSERCRVITDCRNPLALLCASHIAVLASSLEGCSNALLEAMAVGLPVVASDAGGNRELVVEGRGGHRCPVGDVGAFAEALARLASDQPLAAEMGRYNAALVAERFTDDVMIERTLALYRSILGRGKLSPREGDDPGEMRPPLAGTVAGGRALARPR